MFKNPVRVLFLLIAIFILALLVDLPKDYRVNTNIFGIPINFTTNPPYIDQEFLGKRIRREFQTRLGLDLAGGTQVVLEADMSAVEQDNRKTALESAKEVIERRVNFFGVAEPIVQSAQSAQYHRIIVELPGITDTEDAISLIGQTAKLELREIIDTPESTAGAFFIPTVSNTKPLGISGKDLKKAEISFSTQTGEPEVAIEFTSEGTKKFADATSRLVGKQLPIFLDDLPLTWPTVNTPITDGRAVITGSFQVEDAKTLALQLNAGALPVPVKIVEKRIIGASLGADSMEKSLKAGVVGLTIVGLYMIAQYGFLGMIAVVALIFYGVLTFAIFRIIPITLTLPGVAGFFLSVGMAVDANILIFERYKEETRRGKPWKLAIELGFGKAWDSIRDANITTIITALILYNPGNWQFLPSSGLVRGFAATLLIGVIMGLFTGIVVSRTLIRIFYRPLRRKSI